MLELLAVLLKALQEKIEKGEATDTKTVKLMAQIRAVSLDVEKDIKAKRKAQKVIYGKKVGMVIIDEVNETK